MKYLRVFCLALVCAALPWAQGSPTEAFQVQNLSPSIRVNGMGEAGVALFDEPSGYYNPGSAALSSPAHTIQSQFYMSGMEIFIPIYYSYFDIQAATERVFDRTRIRAALYGYRMKLDTKELEPDLFDEIADNIGASLAWRSVVDLGIGTTVRRYSADYGVGKGSATTYDVGLMSIVPVVDIAKRYTERDFSIDHVLYPRLDIGMGIMWGNAGKRNVNYTYNTSADSLNPITSRPLPTAMRYGWSCRFGMDWQRDLFRLAIGEMTFSQEISEETHESILDEPYHLYDEKKRGLEISLLETICIRQGYIGKPPPWGDSDGETDEDRDDRFQGWKTSGWTLRSDGLFKIFAHYGFGPDTLRFIARHLSISWSRFEYINRDPTGFSGLFFHRVHSSVGISF